MARASPSPRWYHRRRHRHLGGIAPMGQDLLEVVKDGVAVLTLNRPDRLNAMSGPMLSAMLEALPRLAGDPEVGVVVLTGSGRGFCAGGDVKAMAEGREFSGTFEEKAQALRSSMEVSRWLHEMPKVTIAMVRGAAAGAGLSLALACDLRVASDTARFATAFARVGYSGDFGGSWYLTQLVGTAKARELYYTADIVDAQQALALGIVNRVVPDTRLEEETMALAGQLARGPRVAYRYMKRNFNAAQDALYLHEFARALSLAGARAPKDDWIIMFNEHAAGALKVERSLHESFFQEFGLTPKAVASTPLAPTNLAYTSYLLSVAYGAPFHEALAALLPCYWIYWEVGKELERAGSADPLYKRWIGTYASEEFGTVVRAVLSATDRIAERLTTPDLDTMRAHFLATSRYEWMFWEMGLRREEWQSW